MDFLKKGQQMLNKHTGSNSNNETNTNTNTNTNTGGEGSGAIQGGGAAPVQGGQNAGGEDYGDKGLDFIEKQSGHSFSREQNEKMTDGARGAYEKFSGSKVDSKYSN